MLDIGGSISIHGVTLTLSCLLQVGSLRALGLCVQHLDWVCQGSKVIVLRNDWGC